MVLNTYKYYVGGELFLQFGSGWWQNDDHKVMNGYNAS